MAARDFHAKTSVVDAAPSVPMSPGRAGFVSAAHGSELVVEPMAMPVHIAPPIVAAIFRDSDDRTRSADNRRWRDCRVADSRKSQGQDRPRSESLEHSGAPSLTAPQRRGYTDDAHSSSERCVNRASHSHRRPEHRANLGQPGRRMTGIRSRPPCGHTASTSATEAPRPLGERPGWARGRQSRAGLAMAAPHPLPADVRGAARRVFAARGQKSAPTGA